MTDQEINEAVARGLGVPFCSLKGHEIFAPKDYCHDIKAAWEVVEHILLIVGDDGDYYTVALSLNKNETLCVINELSDSRIEARADTASMAICLAFLKLEAK